MSHGHEDHGGRELREQLLLIENALILLLEGQEKIMSNLSDLEAKLGNIDAKVTLVATDIDTLLAKLAAIPTGGMTPEQQAALDAAVTHAQAIADSLGAIDSKANPGPGPVSGAPSIASISPSTGPVAGGTSLSMSGSGFTGASGVTIDGAPGTGLVVVNDTSLLVTTPGGVGGAASIVVTTPKGVGTNDGMFSYV